MSTAAVFNLMANDGKPDRLTLATGLLNQRIKDVMCFRASRGMDPTPTLLDLEKTHVLHVNAHFKPMAALAFEYNKVRASSGSHQLGGNIQFSIPQFGDFFHDMVMHIVLSPTYTAKSAEITVGSETTWRGAHSIHPAPTKGWDNHATVLETGGTSAYAIVDAFGSTIPTNGLGAGNMVRYVEYPAERLCEEIKFDVNGNPLDDYTWRTVAMLRKFCISDEKLVGYKRMVGQEVEIEGFGGPRACPIIDANASVTTPAASITHGKLGPNHGAVTNRGSALSTYMTAAPHLGAGVDSNQWNRAHAGAAGQEAAVVPGADVPGYSVTATQAPQFAHVQRQALTAVDGPQTPKYWQPSLEIWNRLWFWFNLDARLSVPSVSIPFGQRFISCRLAAPENIVVDFPGIFVQQTITTATNMVAAADATGSVIRNFRPYWQNLAVTAPTVTTIELYINNIFVNPEVHDIFIRRVGFSLIRVFRQHLGHAQSASGSELLSQLKWPIEYMFVGFQPSFNTLNNSSSALAGANPNFHRDWHRMSKTFDSICNLRQQAQIVTTDTVPTANKTKTTTSNISQIIPDTYVVERPVVHEISLSAHGIKVLDAVPASFLHSYEPFHYGGDAIRPSKDAGAMMINFAVFSGCYQVSGYLNTSRARELYLAWQSNYLSSTLTADLIAIAIAINFLLVTDGSAVLRFST